jgi:UDP-3-O-[3-hydroxymyristoyl] glucosamine N-acyltransferase
LSCKIVIGHGVMLAAALQAWREVAPELELRALAIAADAGRDAVEAALDSAELQEALGAVGTTMFVAGDAGFLNFHRLAAVEAARARLLPMPPLVCAGAIVSASASIGDNCLVGAGAVIGHACHIGANAVVNAGVVLAAGVHIGESVWLDEGVLLGRGVEVAVHTRLGLGVCVNHGVRIGAFCVVDKPGRIGVDIAARTYLLDSHAQPLVIVGA